MAAALGVYFAIATFGILKLLEVLAANLEPVTGGTAGLSIPPTASTVPSYYAMLAVAVAAGSRVQGHVAEGGQQAAGERRPPAGPIDELAYRTGQDEPREAVDRDGDGADRRLADRIQIGTLEGMSDLTYARRRPDATRGDAAMKVVMPVAIPEILRFRARTGADRFDEMWQGVLHMTPSPNFRHQTLASNIVAFFHEVWCPRTGGAAVMQVNVSTAERWDQDYRIPDVAVLRRDRVPTGEAMFVQPDVVFEVRAPGDETYEKLAFYAAVGVSAVVVVERETKAVQVFARAGGDLVLAAPSAGGWTLVEPVGVEVRAESIGGASVLHLRLRGQPETDRTV